MKKISKLLNTNVIGANIKTLREQHQLSHEKLSEDIEKRGFEKISVSSLKAYEVSDINHSKAYNQAGMSLNNLATLADYYGVSIEYILGIEKEKTHGIHYICNETGLSENAVDNLLKYCRKTLFLGKNNTLDIVLSDMELTELILEIKRCRELKKGAERDAGAFEIFRKLMGILEK
jgi:hypothetical protein